MYIRSLNSLTHQGRYGSWVMTTKAAHLVPELGENRLPAPLGVISMEQAPSRFVHDVLPHHPLMRVYPDLIVDYRLMIIEDHFLVSRHGITGASLYFDWNDTTGPFASIVSVNGRNAVAPFPWNGKPGDPTFPGAETFLSFRPIPSQGGRHTSWQNHFINGWHGHSGEDRGLDWFDGVPNDLATMHDRHNGRVRQWIMAFDACLSEGLGIAEQTLDDAFLTNTLSVLLWEAKPETHQFLMRQKSGLRAVAKSQVVFQGGLESTKGERKPDFKMAVGGTIRQHVIQSPLSPSAWNTNPSVLFVCLPVTRDHAEQIKQRFGESFMSFPIPGPQTF